MFNASLEKFKIGVVLARRNKEKAAATADRFPRCLVSRAKIRPGILTKPTRVRNTQKIPVSSTGQPTAKNANSLFQRSDRVAKLARIPSCAHRFSSLF